MSSFILFPLPLLPQRRWHCRLSCKACWRLFIITKFHLFEYQCFRTKYFSLRVMWALRYFVFLHFSTGLPRAHRWAISFCTADRWLKAGGADVCGGDCSLRRWVLESPSKSGLGSGSSSSAEPRWGSAEEEETIHSDSSCGWVIQGSAGDSHRGTWLAAPSLSAVQDANSLRTLILPFWFLSGELFPERSYCVFWNECCEILFFTVGEFSAGDLSTKYFMGSQLKALL